jgi:hypothetical protein
LQGIRRQLQPEEVLEHIKLMRGSGTTMQMALEVVENMRDHNRNRESQ